MTEIRLRYVTHDMDRHGNSRYYFRKRSASNKIRLPGLPGSSEFMTAYHACLNGEAIPQAKPKAPVIALTPKTSFKWLCLQYMASHTFKSLDVKTRYNRERVLTLICNERIESASPETIGNASYAQMTSKVIRKIRDRKTDTPNEANSWLKALKAVFGWALENELVDDDPASSVKRLEIITDGHHVWTEQEVAKFENSHPVGSQARLALALFLFTGQRLSDVIRLGPRLIKDGCFSFVQWKGRKRKPSAVSIPVLPALTKIIDATVVGSETYLQNALKRAYLENNFGKQFRKWCDEAGLPLCTAHGLRKAGATIAANNGANPHQLMAIFGWHDIKQAELYTRKADRKRLAKGGMHLIEAA